MILNSELSLKINKYLNDSAKIKITHKKIIRFVFLTKIETLIPELKPLPGAPFSELFKHKKDRVKTALNFDFGSAYPYNTLAEGMEKESVEALSEFVSSIEVYPSKKLLVDLLAQKAIQDIIANIIESGIIEFNKKTNPLFGMIQATGLDKQIKSFINLFLPNFLPKIADFLHNTSFGTSSTLSKDLVHILVNAPFSELILPNEDQLQIAETKLEKLIETFGNDKKIETTLDQFGETIFLKLVKEFGKENIIEFLNVSIDDFEKFNDEISDYLTNEFLSYQKKNPMDKLFLDILTDILVD